MKELYKSFSELLSPILTIFLTIGGILFTYFYAKDRARQLKEKELNLESSKNKIDNELYSNSGGYIILDLPNNIRNIFHDLLKGFEEYAKLKGYSISFSIDNSIDNKIAFKFTILENGVNVSTQTVRNDIKEYIEKVKNGDDIDDLPITISPEEHNLVLTTLKNRLKFIQYNYHLEKNTKEFYENLVNKISSSNFGINSQPAIYIQTGGQNTPRNMISSNSPNSLIGHNNTYENNSLVNNETNIKISNSFNKKKEQIDEISKIIELLRVENELNPKVRQDLITNFDKVKEELSDEENPDENKIYKWLCKTKELIENMVLAHHTVEAIHWLYDSFKIVFTKV